MMAISELNDPESGITGIIKFYQPSILGKPLTIAGGVNNIDLGYYSIILHQIGTQDPYGITSIVLLNEDTHLLSSVKVTDTTYNVSFTERNPNIKLSQIISGGYEVYIYRFPSTSTIAQQSGVNNQSLIKVSTSSIKSIS